MTDAPELPTMTVVEDNPSVASLPLRGLERDGYSVDLASNGREALALGMENAYVAIVLDELLADTYLSERVLAVRASACRAA